jgi:hypothetical protein
MWSFLCRVACGVFQLFALRLRSSERKELEILVLRHEPQSRAVSSGDRGRAWLTVPFLLR